MKYSLSILKNKNLFKTLKCLFSNVLNIFLDKNIFGHSATVIRGFEILLKYPILNFKKTSDMHKKRLDAAL